MDPKKPLIITVYADFNCPWCYVAHKEITNALDQARAAHPNVAFRLEHRPFELDPTLPSESEKPMCRIACYKAKFGCEQKLESVKKLLQARGKEVGIDFHFKGKTRQTTNAHRLVLKAYIHGGEPLQNKMIDALFAAYFEEERDIGCYDMLGAAAERAGLMTAAQATEFLKGNALRDEVKMLIQDAEIKGIKSVPFTIINNQFAIHGAHKSQVFFQALDKIASSYEYAASTHSTAVALSPATSDTTVTESVPVAKAIAV